MTRAATEIIRGGVLREFKFIGSSPGQFWNPVAIPIPCLDPFRLFLARVYGNCGPGGYSGSYYSYPNVGYAYSSGYYPTRTGPAIIAGTFTATAIIGVGTTASDTIAGEGSNGLRTQNVTCSPSLDIVPQTVAL
jgi:hypothetical protein